MDIKQFTKCLKDLVAVNDEVAVPHLGMFVAETMPASFSDNRATINPPYRRVYFRKENVSPSDAGLLYLKIENEMDKSGDQARVELDWCLSRISSELDGGRECLLPDFGTLRVNSRDDIFFVVDENLDVFPEGMGFEPIHLKAPVESKPMPDNTANSLVEEPVLTPVASEAADHGQTAFVIKPNQEEPVVNRTKHRLGAGWMILIILVALTVVCVALAFIFPEQTSTVLDYILYTEEERSLLGL